MPYSRPPPSLRPKHNTKRTLAMFTSFFARKEGSFGSSSLSLVQKITTPNVLNTATLMENRVECTAQWDHVTCFQSRLRVYNIHGLID